MKREVTTVPPPNDRACRRRSAIRGSSMYGDAVKIRQLVTRLRTAIGEFADKYDGSNYCFDLFAAAGCDLPTDATGEGLDPDRDWSTWIYSDVTGFKWALEMFFSALVAIVETRDSAEAVTADGPLVIDQS